MPRTAAAHIQVTPARVAPDDAVMFTVLVPGESDAETTKVSLQVPKGVLPFSYESTPGWTRTLENGPDGATRVVRWTGRAAKDGFVRFAFLASTPADDGEIIWKAVQTYSDGKSVAWIGSPSSDTPAAITTVSKSVSAQNAGGESGNSSVPIAEERPTGSGSSSTFAVGLSITAIGFALVALAISFRQRRST